MTSSARILFRTLLSIAGSGCLSCESPVRKTPDAVPLYQDIGIAKHPIKTNARAQEYFNQGLALIYGFDFDGAIRSFQRMADLDPETPMSSWGIALALGPNYNSSGNPESLQKARDFIKRAELKLAQAGPAERDYIVALSKRYSDLARPRESFEAYVSAMHDLYHSHPDDPDAGVLYADSLMNLRRWKLWSRDGVPADHTTEVLAVLEDVLRRWPEHLGANHLYIHALEASPFPERGLPSAQRLEHLAPRAGHLVHMPAHIYFRTGDYAAAVKSSLAAVESDRAADKSGQHSHPVVYAMHNLYFLAFSATMDGEFQVALDAAGRLSRSATHSDLMDTTTPFVYARFGQWDKVLAFTPLDEASDAVALMDHYFRGCAFARKQDTKRAEQEMAAMEDVYTEMPRGPAFGVLFNSWDAIHTIAHASLEARIAATLGESAKEIDAWTRAVTAQDNLEFDDLPDWYYPVRESLGAALLRSNQAERAESVFRDDLQRNRGNPRSLLGLSIALHMQGKIEEERWNRLCFENRWRGKNAPDISDF